MFHFSMILTEVQEDFLQIKVIIGRTVGILMEIILTPVQRLSKLDPLI